MSTKTKPVQEGYVASYDFEAPEEMVGEAIECPSCDTEITIPEPAVDPISIIPNLTLAENRYTEPAGNVCPECEATP